jgi:hypothetical protein
MLEIWLFGALQKTAPFASGMAYQHQAAISSPRLVVLLVSATKPILPAECGALFELQ